MSDENDIQIDLKSDISEGEKARRKLQEIEQQTKELRSSFQSGNVTLARFNQELRNLEGQANRTRSALDKVDPGKLTGTKRASAKFQTGLAAANIIQDVSAAGPAAGINNILGLAGNNSARQLGGEFIAAAGGAAALTGAIAAAGVAAGTFFVLVDQGLKTNHLGWDDLGSVVNEVGDKAFTRFGTTTHDVLTEAWALVKEGHAAVNPLVGVWNEAAEAVRRNKDEIERASAAARQYSKDVQSLKGLKSDDQEAAEKGGASFGKQLANLGGAGGVDAVIKKLAEAEGDGTINGQLRAVRSITRDVEKARGGDADAQRSLQQRLGRVGYDASGLGLPEADFYDKLDEENVKDQERRRKGENDEREFYDDLDDENVRDQDKHKKDVGDRAKKLATGSGLDSRVDQALLRSALKSGGAPGVATKEVTDQIARELQARGMGASDAQLAAKGIAEEHAAKLGDEVNEKILNPESHKVDRVASSDFARSVESSGIKDVAANTAAMKDQLAEILKKKTVLGP